MSENSILIITCSIPIIITLICCFMIHRAIKKGKISYAGNRPGMTTQTYTRKDVPLGFWGGILVYIFIIILALITEVIFILSGVFGINI